MRHLIIFFILWAVSINSISQWNQSTQFPLSSGNYLSENNDYFGYKVAIDGDNAVVSSPSFLGLEAGSAVVYHQNDNEWEEASILLPDQGITGSKFGFALDIDGDYILIGAQDEDMGTGAVYVYYFDGSIWTQTQKLLPNNPTEGYRFGNSISISGNSVLIGSFIDYVNGPFSGSAYIFHLDDGMWVQQQKLVPSDGQDWDEFGREVSLSDSLAVIGTRNIGDYDGATGAIYVFKNIDNEWVQQDKFTSSDAVLEDNFAWSLSIHGTTIIVGSKYNNEFSDGAGAVYFFELLNNEWEEVQKLLPPETSTSNDVIFGQSVCIDGDIAIVGASHHDNNSSNSGSAFKVVKSEGTWSIVQELIPSETGWNDAFGMSVSISGSTMIGGAPYGSGKDINGGDAYIFGEYGPYSSISTINNPSFKYYPNPFSTKINLDFGQNSAYTHLIITNLLGQEADRIQIQNKKSITWNGGNLSKGIYIVTVFGNDEVESFRIVKQ